MRRHVVFEDFDISELLDFMVEWHPGKHGASSRWSTYSDYLFDWVAVRETALATNFGRGAGVVDEEPPFAERVLHRFGPSGPPEALEPAELHAMLQGV